MWVRAGERRARHLEGGVHAEPGGHRCKYIVHIVLANEGGDDFELPNGCPHINLSLPDAVLWCLLCVHICCSVGQAVRDTHHIPRCLNDLVRIRICTVRSAGSWL